MTTQEHSQPSTVITIEYRLTDEELKQLCLLARLLSVRNSTEADHKTVLAIFGFGWRRELEYQRSLPLTADEVIAIGMIA